MFEETTTYNLIKLFPLDIQDKNIKEILYNAKILNVKVYRKSRKIDITVKCNNLINKRYIDKICYYIQNQYDLSKLNINVKYENIYFDKCYNDYFKNIKYYVEKAFPMCKSLLSQSTCRYDKGRLIINLKFKGAHILKENNCDKIIENLIMNEFADKVKIFFVDNCDIESNDYLKEKKRYEEAAISKALKESNDSAANKLKKPSNKKSKTANITSQIIIGKTVKETPIQISSINLESGKIVIEGDIFSVEIREIRGERYIVSFDITDYTSSISVKYFCKKNKIDNIKNRLKTNIKVKLKGDVQYDKYAKEIVVFTSDIMEIPKQERMDNSKEKRVELHLHTQMSAMDAISSASELIATAARWGHKAIAITDHGVVQAFPEAYSAGKKNNIKIIYGVECYLINDNVPIVYNPQNISVDGDYVVFDIETTGLSATIDGITEIGAVKISNGRIIDNFSTFVNPEKSIPEKIVKLTGITNSMVQNAPKISDILNDFLNFCDSCSLVAHNARFDVGFIRTSARKLNIPFNFTVVDTLELTRALFPNLKRHKLNVVAKYLKVNLENHHRAVDDAKATADIFIKCLNILKQKNINNLVELNSTLAGRIDIKKLKPYHAVILVKNYIGLKNLYKIVSESHLKYFYKKPRIPKSLFMQYREGLIIGTACEAGELYKAVLEAKPEKEISNIVKFYDYLEIQPLGNNKFMIENGIVENFNQLEDINKKIIKLGERYNKPVVATCDVHFLNSRDEVFRRVLMAGQGYKDADNQPPLYFRTTEEMLKEFEYLSEDKAREIVIENTNKIADMIEDILPIPKETFPPEIEGAEDEIRSLSLNRAKELYGNEFPPIVKERMDKELHSIIKNGFSVMYIIAQKLVQKSLSDGYLVGSRGSVGSSFIAYLTGITEVNALPPHYVCPKCKYSEFITDGSIGSGVDLPDKNCPKCGYKLKKDGHDIPFETFLGFDGDKEPDIDLNFSGEYQPVAHKYTEELFGVGHVFRAGTIGTIAEKTAYGFVKKYLEKKDMVVSNAEINRLVKGCTGIKRTTGQHPGGVMIVPRRKEIYDFCPIQHPADDTNSDIITTHFDYHSISGRLLKLDILGHDDPTMIRMLEDLTGITATNISLDDKETMSIFFSTKALGVTQDDINCKVGSFGIPEFGTRFVRQMLVDTIPKSFAELVRISGLSHGTDVWLNNAQDLIRDEVAELSEVICTRDDIMLYLIHKGLDHKHSFKIMESVRKGRGLKPEDEQAMIDHNVPKWYIDSCKKIKYMFPKAHAVAYVTMAFRIAYFKVHYPKAFYTTYFTVRADDFDAMLMTNGVDKVRNKIKELESKGNNVTVKEKSILTILELCNEMYSRGIKFIPIDIYKSDAVKFICTDEGILPPLNGLQGLGIAAAKNIIKARKKGKFVSIDDFRIRCKVSKSVIEILKEYGCFKDMPETSQMSLF